MISLFMNALRLFRSFFQGLKESREFLVLALFLIILTSSSTYFYTKVEGWRVLDSLFFVIVTITTVGYGDLTPQTDLGKLFTIILILLGVGAMIAFITTLAKHAIGYQKESLKQMRDFVKNQLNNEIIKKTHNQ